MLLLVTKAHPQLERLRADLGPDLGRLIVPGHTSSVERTAAAGVPWACDNAAFSNFDERAFRLMLARVEGLPGCRFVVAPDVVADAGATLARFASWVDFLRTAGQPLALAAQDGLERLPVPWGEFDALFVGGSTEWKLGDAAARLAREAKERGKWVHVGRVNSHRRALYCRAIGADSVDGTKLARYTDAHREWARGLLEQPRQETTAGL